MVKAILAISKDLKVGSSYTKSGLPWEHGTYPEDMRMFKEKTLGCTVVMGRKTFLHTGKLKNRLNLVITSSLDLISLGNGLIPRYWEETLKTLSLFKNRKDFWVIGGVSIYKQLASQIEEFHITRISDSYPDADVEFNVDELLDEHGFTLVESTPLSDKCTVEVWRK